PAGEIREGNDGADRDWQFGTQSLELVALEESLSRVVFLKQGDFRPKQNLPPIQTKHEGAFERRQLAIDLTIRGFGFLPAGDVAPYIGRCDRRGAPALEVRQ